MKNFTFVNSRLAATLLILSFFYLLNFHANDLVKFIFTDLSGYQRWGIRMVVEVTGSFITVMILYKTWLTGALKEMAMIKPVHPAFIVAIIATLPMMLSAGIGSSWTISANPVDLLYFTILSPVSEEILFRGFAFWMLYRYVRLGFWAAALLPAAVFGAMHMAQSQELMEQVGIIAITGIGGIWFSWLLMKWENLWVPIAFHILMNFWWELFEAGDNAFGDVIANISRFLTVFLSILFTVRKDKLPVIMGGKKPQSVKNEQM